MMPRGRPVGRTTSPVTTAVGAPSPCGSQPVSLRTQEDRDDDVLDPALDLLLAPPALLDQEGKWAPVVQRQGVSVARSTSNPGRSGMTASTASTMSGSTLIELADLHGVSVSMIKRVVRDEGAWKCQRTP